MESNARVVEITWPNGSRGRAESCRAEVMALVCAQAYAPGQPLTFVASNGEREPVTLVGKAIGSKKRADGSFDVRVRLHSMTREHRAWVEAAFSS